MSGMTLKKVGDDIRARLKAAERAGHIPGREPGDGYGWIRYDVRVSNAKSGPKVNVTINGYEWLIPNIEDAASRKQWHDTRGTALLAMVDQVVGRDRFRATDGSPGIGGETKFGMCLISARATTVTRIDRDGNKTVEEIA